MLTRVTSPGAIGEAQKLGIGNRWTIRADRIRLRSTIQTILAKRGAITFCTRLTRATDLIKVRCTLPWTRVLKDWRNCRNIKGAVLEQACQNLVLSWRTLRARGNYTQFIYPDRAGLIKARCALIILCRSALGQVVSCVAHHSRAHRTLSGTIGAIQVIAAVAGPLAIVGIVRIARAYEICIGNRCTC